MRSWGKFSCVTKVWKNRNIRREKCNTSGRPMTGVLIVSEEWHLIATTWKRTQVWTRFQARACVYWKSIVTWESRRARLVKSVAVNRTCKRGSPQTYHAFEAASYFYSATQETDLSGRWEKPGFSDTESWELVGAVLLVVFTQGSVSFRHLCLTFLWRFPPFSHGHTER